MNSHITHLVFYTTSFKETSFDIQIQRTSRFIICATYKDVQRYYFNNYRQVLKADVSRVERRFFSPFFSDLVFAWIHPGQTTAVERILSPSKSLSLKTAISQRSHTGHFYCVPVMRKNFPLSVEQLMQQIEQNRPAAIAAAYAAPLLRKSIEPLVQLNLTCQSAADCAIVYVAPYGCQSLPAQFVYSKRNKYATIIEELGKDALAQSYLANQLGGSNICTLVLPDKADCVNGICVFCPCEGFLCNVMVGLSDACRIN